MIARTLVLALAWFAAVNACSSLLAWLTASLLPEGRADRPRLLLAIRIFPSAASMIFVAAVFLPSHWVFEPRDAVENLGLLWYSLSAAGAFVIARGVARAAAISRAARRLALHARPSPIGIAGAHEVEGLEGVSLAGVFKTRIVVAAEVARQLTPAELDVAVAHEVAHRDAFDNLTRVVMMCAPDFFGASRAAGRLERRWHVAAETRADDRAVRGDGVRAVHLASALVKVARLSAGVSPSPAWSTLNDPSLLERRVRRLLTGAAPSTATSGGATVAMMATIAAGLLVLVPAVTGSIHRLTEALIDWLP